MNKLTLGLYFHLFNAASFIRQSAIRLAPSQFSGSQQPLNCEAENVHLAVSRCFVTVCLPASGPDCTSCVAEVSALSAVAFCVKVSDKEQKTTADRSVSSQSLAARTIHIHCNTNLTQPTLTQAAESVTDFQTPAVIP
jgi:hypothetical protein